MTESGLNGEGHVMLNSFLGKKLIAYSQKENTGNFFDGDWQDDEPLCLTFEDGTVLRVWALGWHNSGSLKVDRV